MLKSFYKKLKRSVKRSLFGEKKISVVCPIYNREKHLKQSIDSLLEQTHHNLDIILVDDGSTDSSLHICQRYAAQDRRIRVISQANQGQGVAMNAGIEAAVGDYIAFLESDDWLDPTMYETMLRRAEAVQADLVKANFYLVKDENGSREVYKQWRAIAKQWGKKPFSLREEPRIANIHASIWASLYSMDMIKHHHLRFVVTPNATYADRSWMPQAYAAAKKITFVNKPLYFYRKMDNHVQSGNRNDELCFYMPFHCIKARTIYKNYSVYDHVLEYDYKHSYICCMHYFKKVRHDLRDQYFALFHDVMANVHDDGLQYSQFNDEEKNVIHLILENKKYEVYKLLCF